MVFHLAAQIDVRRSVADPAADARVNVEGTINVLERRARGRRAAASSTPRPAAPSTARREHPDARGPAGAPVAPYGQAKLCAEGYCALFTRLHGLSTVSLRYANVYGPRQDPLGEAGVIAIFCGCCSTAAGPTIFGDGQQTRDYVYVGDVVEANLRAAELRRRRLVQRRPRRRDDRAGPGRGVPPQSATAFEPEHAPARAGEVLRSCLDASRAREERVGGQGGPRAGLAKTSHPPR